MAYDNSLNPSKGRAFQNLAAEILTNHFKVDFQLDYPIPIGDPPKDHRFDLVSKDTRYVGECKNYSWTESGNIPSAKMGFVNEAVFYLTYIPPKIERFIVMRRDTHPKRNESLVDYYYRTYRHLLNDIFIIEIDVETGNLRRLG